MNLIAALVVLMLGIGGVVSFVLSYLIERVGNPESPLAEFYVVSLSYTLVEAGVLLLLAAFLVTIYHRSTRVRFGLDSLLTRAGTYIRSLPTWKFSLFAHAAAAAVLFALNAPGLLNATFMIDDYMMYSIATSSSVWQLFWTPVNEHVIPLFWLELKAVFALTGPHPVPLNLLLFAPMIAVVGSAATLLRKLGFGTTTLVVLLVTFASTMIVSHQMYGFYAVAPYTQVLAAFVLSLLAFVYGRERGNSWLISLSYLLLAVCVLIESGAVWTPLAYVAFIYAYHVARSETWNPLPILKREWRLVLLGGLLLIAYAVYLAVLATVATETFYGPGHAPVGLKTMYELYRVLTAGALLALFAPRLGLIFSQPRFIELLPFWEMGMALLALSYLGAMYWGFKTGGKVRVWSLYFTLMLVGTAALVAIARANSYAIPYYRDQNMVFSLLFLAMALAVIADEWIKRAGNSVVASRRLIVVAFLVLVLVGQHVFSFYKIQYVDDFAVNRALIERFKKVLVPPLQKGVAEHGHLYIPTLNPFFFTEGFQHQFRTLSEFGDFLGIKGVTWLPTNKGPYLASTSPAFIDMLKTDEGLRSLYFATSDVPEFCSTTSFGKDARSIPERGVLLARTLEPEKQNRLFIDLSATDAPEKVYVELNFKNDFGVVGTTSVRMDQYTKQVEEEGTGRRHACRIELNEIPAFALSHTVRNFTIDITTPGSYTLHGYYFE